MQSRNINSSIVTLRSTIEPPPENIVAASFQELSSLGAIKEDGAMVRPCRNKAKQLQIGS
jgi:HrpA-like RNA helicase